MVCALPIGLRLYRRFADGLGDGALFMSWSAVGVIVGTGQPQRNEMFNNPTLARCYLAVAKTAVAVRVIKQALIAAGLEPMKP